MNQIRHLSWLILISLLLALLADQYQLPLISKILLFALAMLLLLLIRLCSIRVRQIWRDTRGLTRWHLPNQRD